MSDIVRRIEREAGVADLAALLAERLAPTDLQSLLLEVYRRRAAARGPAELLRDFVANRFVRPAAQDPVQLLAWEQCAFAALPAEFERVELSPVCPLGTSSIVATVHQNLAVATSRNSEVVSDPTNVLALECALRRRERLRADARSTDAVLLAARQRVVRGQNFGEGASAHFHLFSLVSAGRDRAGAAFAHESLARHLRAHLGALRAFLGPGVRLRVAITDLAADPPRPRFAGEALAELAAGVPGVEVVSDPARASGRGYYQDVCFKLQGVAASGELVEVGDGGAVDWARALLGNAKERLFISGLGGDRVVGLRG